MGTNFVEHPQTLAQQVGLKIGQASEIRLVIPRPRRPDTELEAKEVWVDERRYVVCRNLTEARRDAEGRDAVLRSLRVSLRGGDKALVGNSAYRRYLKTRTKSTSRSTTSGWRTTPDMTASMSCEPTPP